MDLYFKNKKTGERIDFPFFKNKADDKDEFELTCDEFEKLKKLNDLIYEQNGELFVELEKWRAFYEALPAYSETADIVKVTYGDPISQPQKVIVLKSKIARSVGLGV